ncbi:MAG: type VI secretion system protein TssA [Chitinispirillaceae bacterium]|nr:type VI secretion system protein TssA [Chitinispirillaceae bacterium]
MDKKVPFVVHETIQQGGCISELLSIIVTPISEAQPYGGNINHDADFDTLKAEFGKIGNLDVGLIESTATKILKEKAKDIRVLSFLAYVMLRKGDWEALADIFDGLTQLSVKNFDALQPDRERARELAFKWLSEDRFGGALVDKKPAEPDYAQIARLIDALAKLKPVLENKFPQGAPFPSELQRNAIAWEKSCKPKPAAPAGGAAPAGQASSAADPMETPKQAMGIARRAALFLIEKEPQRPMGYRLMRSLRWDILEKSPPAEAGKTQLPGPAAQQRTYFQGLIAQQDWKTALEKGEAAFAAASNHLWLDLQRIITTACDKLGQQYREVKSAVLSETACFIKRVPDIVPLNFADGSPFCDETTKRWLSGEVRTVFSAAGGAPEASPTGDLFEKELKKVNEFVGSGKIEEAIDLVQSGIRTAKCERESFRRSMLVGTLLLQAKQADIAVSVLEMLDQKAGVYSLDKWDPDLAVEAWSLLVQAYRAARAGKPANIQVSLQEKQNSILTKVSCIDPKKALQLNK